jgi:hypothetical protein
MAASNSSASFDWRWSFDPQQKTCTILSHTPPLPLGLTS